MRWKARPIRQTVDFTSDASAGEAALSPVSGLGGVRLAPAGGRLPGFYREGRPSHAGRGSSGHESEEESAENAQQSARDGVEEDMATLVLDNSGLGSSALGGSARGAGQASRPDARANEGLDPTG